MVSPVSPLRLPPKVAEAIIAVAEVTCDLNARSGTPMGFYMRSVTRTIPCRWSGIMTSVERKICGKSFAMRCQRA